MAEKTKEAASGGSEFTTAEFVNVDGTMVKIYDVRNASGEDKTVEYLQSVVNGEDEDSEDSPWPESLKMLLEGEQSNLLDEQKMLLEDFMTNQNHASKHVSVLCPTVDSSSVVRAGSSANPVDLRMGSSTAPIDLVSPTKTPAIKRNSPLNDASTIYYPAEMDAAVQTKIFEQRKLIYPKKAEGRDFIDAICQDYGVQDPAVSALNQKGEQNLPKMSSSSCSIEKKSSSSCLASPLNTPPEGWQVQHASAKQARLATLQLSTAQLHKCVQDRKQSSSTRKIFVCWSCLNPDPGANACTPVKSAEAACPPDESAEAACPPDESVEATCAPVLSKCPFKIVWNKKTKNGRVWWVNNVQQSVYEHSLDCWSPQVIRREQLCSNVAFGKSIIDDKSASIDVLYNAALEPGILQNGLKAHTLYRAKDRILRQDAKFYRDDFCKLRQWGRDLVALNPGSMFDIEVDEKGRYVNGSFLIILSIIICSFAILSIKICCEHKNFKKSINYCSLKILSMYSCLKH